jgi:hypothetical protein
VLTGGDPPPDPAVFGETYADAGQEELVHTDPVDHVAGSALNDDCDEFSLVHVPGASRK